MSGEKKIMGQDEIEGMERDLHERRQAAEVTEGVVNESLPVVAHVAGRLLVIGYQEARNRFGFYVSADRQFVAIPGVPRPMLCSIGRRH